MKKRILSLLLAILMVTHLYHAPAQDIDTHSSDAGEDKGGQVVYDCQWIAGRSGKSFGRQQTAYKNCRCQYPGSPEAAPALLLKLGFRLILHESPPFQ